MKDSVKSALFGLTGRAGSDIQKPAPTRLRREFFEVQNGVVLETFLKYIFGNRLVGISFYVDGHEAMKFDCSGNQTIPTGHYHADMVLPKGARRQERIDFFEASPYDQIERALFELGNNLAFYLQRHPSRRVRKTRIDAEALDTALASARAQLHEFLSDEKQLVADTESDQSSVADDQTHMSQQAHSA